MIMNIRTNLVLYLILIFAISTLFVMALFIENKYMSISILLLLMCAILVFYFIYKDFILPLSLLENWFVRYEKNQDLSSPPSVQKSSLHAISQAANHLLDEEQNLYDDMENVLKKQIERLTAKSSLLETLYNISANLNTMRGSKELLTYFLQIFMGITDANAGVIRLLDDENFLNLAHVKGNLDNINQEKKITQGACLCTNIALSPKVRVQFSVHTCAKCVGIATKQKSKYGTIFIPFHDGDKPLGIVSLFFDKTPSLTQDERALLKAIGEHLAMALNRAKNDMARQRLYLNQERLFLSQDIHDSLSQVLHSINLQTSVLLDIIKNGSRAEAQNKAKDIANGINQAHTELRHLMHHFRIPLDAKGINASIENLVHAFRAESCISVYLQHKDKIDVKPEIEVQILRIVKEALTNAKKHAKAKNIRILVSQQHLIIEDDGVGFDSKNIDSHSGFSLGFEIMKERAERIGATLSVESEISEGTQIMLKFSNMNHAC